MKKLNNFLKFIILILFTFTIACIDSKKENEEDILLLEEDTTDVEEAIIDENDPSVWIYDYDADIPVKNREVHKDDFSVEQWIDFLNANNEKVQLEFVKQSGDTLFVKIPESAVLTQQMGTTGADGYLSVATYTLTEFPGVNYVHFDFEEGDHAMPGIYSRQYYVDRNKERFK